VKGTKLIENGQNPFSSNPIGVGNFVQTDDIYNSSDEFLLDSSGNFFREENGKMQNKSLKGLSKVDMLTLLYEQEKEIERLSFIMKNDPIVEEHHHETKIQTKEKIKNDEPEKLEIAEKKEKAAALNLEETSRRIKEAERRSKEAAEVLMVVLGEIQRIYQSRAEELAGLHKQYIDFLRSTDLINLITDERQGELKS